MPRGADIFPAKARLRPARRRFADPIAGIGLAIAAAAVSWPAQAQPYPGAPLPPQSNPVCARLEAQLASLDRPDGDARGEQIRRQEDAANRQQQDLDRVVAQARQMGCSNGFFIFSMGQPPQCDRLNAEIQRQQANLNRTLGVLQQLRSTGSYDREAQRRPILAALAQNDCGPQYRAAAPARPRGFFEALFGPPAGAPEMPVDTRPTSAYRTVCVRACDGFFFPISNTTVQARFADDERTCQRLCPASEASLYIHRSQGEDISRAVSLTGRPYSEHPNAFRYRQEYNAACSCKQAGQSWAEALASGGDETLRQGDIVVTEEKARELAQPKAEAPKPAKPEPSKTRNNRNAPQRGAKSAEAASPPAPPEPPEEGVDAPPMTSSAPGPAGPEGPRAVGPHFYPAR